MGNGSICCGSASRDQRANKDEVSSVISTVPFIVPTVQAECVLRCQNQLSGSVLWCPRQQRLFWLDLSKQEIWSLEPAEGKAVHQKVEMGQGGGCLALRQDGGFVVCSALGIGLLEAGGIKLLGPKLKPRIVCHPIESEGLDPAVVRLAGGRVDPQGRLVVGSVHLKYHDSAVEFGHELPRELLGKKDPRGGVYRISVTSSILWGPTGQLEVLKGLGKVSAASGMAFSMQGDEEVMYFSDAPTQRVRCFRYGNVLSGETCAAEPQSIQGRPCGACVDSDGGYWVAQHHGGRILRFKDGWVDMMILVAAPMVTDCTFGGPDLGVMYITTAMDQDPCPTAISGSVFTCVLPGIKGVPENYFSG